MSFLKLSKSRFLKSVLQIFQTPPPPTFIELDPPSTHLLISLRLLFSLLWRRVRQLHPTCPNFVTFRIRHCLIPLPVLYRPPLYRLVSLWGFLSLLPPHNSQARHDPFHFHPVEFPMQVLLYPKLLSKKWLKNL